MQILAERGAPVSQSKNRDLSAELFYQKETNEVTG